VTGEVKFERLRVEGVAVELIAVEGPPALAVMAACLGGFGDTPDLVVAGINAGANTGRAVLHSGTVGAALTGLNLGRPGLAVSQAAGEPFHWATAASIAVSVVDRIPRLTRPVVINLNVPNCDRHRVKGVVTATLDPGGRVQATMIEERRGVLQLSIPDRRRPAAGTDNALLDDGYATVTALAGPHSVGLPLEALWAVERVPA
jgi:5'-nucleotidase